MCGPGPPTTEGDCARRLVLAQDFAGHLIDEPGAAVQDALRGEWTDAAQVLQFNDCLGHGQGAQPFAIEQPIHGRPGDPTEPGELLVWQPCFDSPWSTSQTVASSDTERMCVASPKRAGRICHVAITTCGAPPFAER